MSRRESRMNKRQILYKEEKLYDGNRSDFGEEEMKKKLKNVHKTSMCTVKNKNRDNGDKQMKKKLQIFHKKDINSSDCTVTKRKGDCAEEQMQILYENDENYFDICQRQGQDNGDGVRKKDFQLTGADEGRATRKDLAVKNHPRRFMKQDFITRLKKTRLSRTKKPWSTYELLPKFSEQQRQKKKKVTSGYIKDAAAVLEVRKYVTSLVMKEQQLTDVALDDYNTFLNELTGKGIELFSHEFENECGKHVLKLDDVKQGSVQHTPLVCRQEQRSYLLPLTVRASYICVDASGCKVRDFSHQMFLGEIPLMVGSKLCPTSSKTNEEAVAVGQQPGEPGGYFIVDGIEKFIPFCNLPKKNNPLVTKCSGQESQKFSFNCSVLSSTNGIETFRTVVLVSIKHGLVGKLSLGRGVNVLMPLSKVFAALGIQSQLKPQKETKSFMYLRQTLSAMKLLNDLQKETRNRGKATLTRDTFRCKSGSKSVVSETILDYLVAAAQVPGMMEQDLHKIHRKCEKSESHHFVLLKIATKYFEMSQEEMLRQDQKYKHQLTALRDVMLQGCEDVPAVANLVTAALTLPSEEEALKPIQQAAKGVWKDVSISKVLERVLVPHAGRNLPQRAFYLAFIANQLLLVMCGRRSADNPLHLGHRMLLTPGAFFKNLFNSMMKPILQQARNTIENQYKKPRAMWTNELDYEDYYEDDKRTFGEDLTCKLRDDEKVLYEKFDVLNIFQFHHNILKERMCKIFRSVMSGQGPNTIKGVTQNLERLNYMQYLSQVRSVNGEDKVMSDHGSVPHQLHFSTVGFFCLVETPENENVGLTEHLTLGATMSHPVEPAHVQQVLQMLPVKLFTEDECPAADQLGKVFVDGRWVGNAEAPVWHVKKCLVEYRRCHTLHLSVHLRNHDLHIDTSRGRPMRPLLVVQAGALILTDGDLPTLRECCFLLDDLWSKGIVDFVDPLENSEAFIAEIPTDLCKEGVDYCQLETVLNYGIVSAATSVGSTNPGVRRLISCKMQKQAMGQPMVSELLTHRTRYSVLKTPEMPLAIPAFILDLPNSKFMYSGQSALTAVMAVCGFNQEDGLVFSQGAIDRGLFTSLHFHYYQKFEPQLGAEVIACAEVGQRLEAGDIVITCKDKHDNVQTKDIETPSEVSRSHVRHMPDGRVLYEVETVQERKPEVGDKFGTLNGQKGVICGILPDRELPKLEDGRTPDIFISPHSFLDRQTLGFFLEGILNTLAVHTGFLLDATSIDSGWDLQRAQEALHVQGLSSSVKVLSSRGREMGYIFCAPIFYMRLKHLAVLKCHARHDGPVDSVFRQPTEGLAQGGGLRLGEMEVAALLSHAAAELVQEFMHDQSDGLQRPYCNTCLKYAEMVGEYVHCRQCRRIHNLVLRKTTYSFKIFEECLVMMNLELLQYGQGHECTESDMEYENLDLSSLSCDEEPEARDMMDTITKKSFRRSFRFGGQDPVPAEGNVGHEMTSNSTGGKDSSSKDA